MGDHLGKSALPRKKADQDWTDKVIFDHKIVRGSQEVFEIFSGDLY